MENSELNDTGSLPMGNSSQGATPSSMGDASKADLSKGYFNADTPPPEHSFEAMMTAEKGGVVGRPEGWAR